MRFKSERWGNNYELVCWERTGIRDVFHCFFSWTLHRVIVIKEKVAKHYGREWWVWFGAVTLRNVLVSLGCYNITIDELTSIDTSHLWILSHQRSGWCLMVSGLCLIEDVFLFFGLWSSCYILAYWREKRLVNFLLL